MNKARRTIIASITEKLYEITSLLENVAEGERNAFENMPESIQSSERGETMENAIVTLEDHTSAIEDAIRDLDEL